MGKINVKQVNVFTVSPQSGNAAGVVLEGSRLSEKQMLAVARELHLPETAFIVSSVKPGIDIKIRCLAPYHETAVSGHALVAGVFALAEEGLLGMSKKGKYQFQADTPSGILPVEVIKQEGAISVMITVNFPTLTKATQYKTDLVRLLNINLSDFDNRMVIVRNDSLFIGIKRLHALFGMKPNSIALANFLETRGINGVCAYTTETIDRESVVHSRYFAPHLGIAEDSVTFSTHSSLALILQEIGALDLRDGPCVIQGEQGDVIGRRGRVSMELQVEDKKPTAIKIGGNAITVMEGELLLND